MTAIKLFPIIFLDIDGVLNCQQHYEEQLKQLTKGRGKKKKARVQSVRLTKAYYQSELSRWRLELLNELCEQTGAKVVISSSWRLGYGLPKLRQLLRWGGAAFEVLDVTPTKAFGHVVRGQEIRWWLEEHVKPLFDLWVSDYRLYAIVDDDSDMLLGQRANFFQTDGYAGLTPTTCYKIKRHFDSFKHNAWTPPK